MSSDTSTPKTGTEPRPYKGRGPTRKRAATLGERMTGFTEEIVGTITHDISKAEHGREMRTGVVQHHEHYDERGGRERRRSVGDKTDRETIAVQEESIFQGGGAL